MHNDVGDYDSEAGISLLPLLEQQADAPTTALLALYDTLPGGVVAVVEYERQTLITHTLDHVRRIRDALAKDGKFKGFCQAVGWNYSTVSNRLSRADSKLQVTAQVTGSLPAPDADADAESASAWAYDNDPVLEAYINAQITVAQYEAHWREEQQARRAALVDYYAAKFLAELPGAAHWTRRNAAVREATRKIDGGMGITARDMLAMGIVLAQLRHELDDDEIAYQGWIRTQFVEDRRHKLHVYGPRTWWRLAQWTSRVARHVGLLDAAPETWGNAVDERIQAVVTQQHASHILRHIMTLGVLDDLERALTAA